MSDRDVRREKRANRAALVDRGLRIQLRIFLVIFAIMIVLDIVHIVDDRVNILWALLGFGGGIVLGRALARTKVLRWDPTERVVVGTMDLIGAAILGVYLLFVIFRGRILGGWLEDGHVVGVIGLSLTAGAMLGRVIFTFSGIRRVLAAAGVTSPPPSP